MKTAIEEPKLCDFCANKTCVFQSGIPRIKCDFYIAPKEPKTERRIKTVTNAEEAEEYQISEDVAKAFQFGLVFGFGEKHDEIGRVIDEIKKVITPQPKTGWIPVSERLPEKSGKYWCTFGGTYLTGSDYYTTEYDAKELFDDVAEEYAGWLSKNVIAWMSLPEAYVPDTNIEKMPEIQTECSNCENCEHDDGECCRLLFEAMMESEDI